MLRACFGSGLLFFFILIVYSNTLQASWHLDDYSNIIQNCHLHITDLNPDSICRTFFSHPGSINKLYRPFPCLTFAINWYFGKDNVIGYHIVNITIHFLTAFILFLTILNLFKSPNLKDKYQGSEYFIALLTATLWAINPIQTQAVTYIVQRMASMAAMFYVLGIYFYVKGRTNNSRLISVFSYMGCFLSFAFALGSKENTATLPLALLLVEVVFFRNLHVPETRRKILWVSVGTLFLVILIGALLFMSEPLSFSFLNGYERRSFTFLERMMTEPRILVYYITQIFYPVPNRLSIEHDVTISTSLFEPWTTMPAILIILLVIGIGLSQITKRPIVAFGILFFLLNHLIESTILPLELIFEHRNYLPSLFLFFPVAAGLKSLLDYYGKEKRFMYLILVSFITLLLIGFGSATYIRNMAWATEKSLWEDVMVKSPGNPRPYQNLAICYEGIGRFDKALELYKKALPLKDQEPRHSQFLSLNNMGNIYRIKNEYEKAIELYKRAIDIYPKNELAQYNMIFSLVNSERWEEASENANLLLSKKYYHEKYLNLKGFILIKQKRPEEAIPYLRSALRLAPNNRNAIVNMGVALSLMGKHKKAEWFLKRANQIYPNDITILLCLIENSLRAGDEFCADRYLEKLFASVSINDIRMILMGSINDDTVMPYSRELLAPVIAHKLKKKSEEIGQLGYRQSGKM